VGLPAGAGDPGSGQYRLRGHRGLDGDHRTDDYSLKDGVVTTSTTRQTERYLRSGGLVGYYAGDTARNGSLISVSCQDLAVQRVLYRTNKLAGFVRSASEFARPTSWGIFESFITHTNYVRWTGRETVAGQVCDVVELTLLGRKAPDAGSGVVAVTSTRFYVNPAGLIERMTMATDGESGARTFFKDQRITYDAKAKLTPEDFSRERFERDAAAVLQGEPMPELEDRTSFAAGGSLPDTAFTGWADKKPFRISDLKGKVVVLETWASWCHFCKEAFPFYEKMRQKLADQDVVFVAVSFDEKLENYEKWMNAHGADYGFKFGRIDAEDPMKAMKDFKGSLPAFYVVGRDGKIVSSYMGYGYGKGGEDPRLLEALRKAGVKL
jgi:thiol-disulfide isomerase/thioredoxin